MSGVHSLIFPAVFRIILTINIRRQRQVTDARQTPRILEGGTPTANAAIRVTVLYVAA